MNTKKLLLMGVVCVTFLAVACSPSSTAEEDQLYENSIHKKTKNKEVKNG